MKGITKKLNVNPHYMAVHHVCYIHVPKFMEAKKYHNLTSQLKVFC